MRKCPTPRIDQALGKGFPPLIWIAHWVCFKWLLFLSPARNMRLSFLTIHSLVPRGKIHEHERPH